VKPTQLAPNDNTPIQEAEAEAEREAGGEDWLSTAASAAL
jgi:hypothetical protein